MSTNRELLELAAKAAGRIVGPDDQGDPIDRKYTPELGLWCVGPWAGWFNPFNNDGDAFRLAGALHMEITFRSSYVVVEGGHGPNSEAYEYHRHDKMAAARRAIVRTAAEDAEIGRLQ